jgi:pimeloyl-ACP methyl ester carboxylesterase
VTASSRGSLPVVLVPGLNCSARLYAEQIPALWRFGPVMVADHTRDASIAAIAGQILANAPPFFALVGLSLGGYIAFEIMRQAPQRVGRLALLDTSARPDTAELTARRQAPMARARAGKLIEVADESFVFFVHPNRYGDVALRAVVRAMAEETGAEAYLRQQQAIIARPDSRPGLAAIKCPTLVLVGDSDEPTPPELAREMAAAIPGAKLVVVADCGHLSTLERPQAVTRALVELLGGR